MSLYLETEIKNIITYKESFMDKRCLCIVMDYADGGDLYTKIAN